jgi:predicted RNA-binding protein with TRAM domain
VTFAASANNGAAITSYTATCVSANGGATSAKAGAGSPLVVTGVTTGKTYTCSVKATNSRGAGPSAPALSVIVGSPAPPTGVSAVKIAAGQLRVTFTAGANNGAAVSSFTATCASSNGGATSSRTGAGSPITVTGLTTGKAYTCTVNATNSRGAGLASAASATVNA